MNRSISLFPSLACVFVLLTTATGADWPQYRKDATRSTYTAETLPDDQVHALDAATGVERWSFFTTRDSKPRPTAGA